MFLVSVESLSNMEEPILVYAVQECAILFKIGWQRLWLICPVTIPTTMGAMSMVNIIAAMITSHHC